jgi:hypothetical protein
VFILGLCFVILPPARPADQAATGKNPVSYDVYDSRRSIQGTQLSRDGTWLVYSPVPQDEFFNHFLRGTPRPDWMENGVPYLERGKRDIDSLFKKK